MTEQDEQKTFLIMGGNGGVGSTVARALRARNHQVVVAGRNESELEKLANEIEAQSFTCDATKFEDVAAAVDFTTKRFGKLTGILNAVGSLYLKPAHITTPEDWLTVINTNLTSAFACVKFGAKAMMTSGGSIVLVSSAAAKIGMPNHEAMAAAKGGIAALALSASSTYARQKIRVNCIAPGLMDTKLTKSITQNEMQLDASLQMHPMGRIGTPEDVAPAILWLLSDESSWVTGETISIDGGLAHLKSKVTAKA